MRARRRRHSVPVVPFREQMLRARMRTVKSLMEYSNNRLYIFLFRDRKPPMKEAFQVRGRARLRLEVRM